MVRYEVFGTELLKKETDMKVLIGMKVATETGEILVKSNRRLVHYSGQMPDCLSRRHDGKGRRHLGDSLQKVCE